jgi:eukaryotic-like serine/threonine-protein kinase
MVQRNPFSIVPPTAWGAHEEVDPLGRPTGSIFVGREREIEALRAGLEAALAGHGRLILLVGEPGIGKTWTVHELGTHARQRGTEVLLGRCDEGDGAPSFWPWVQVVRAYVAHRAPEILQAEMGAGAAVIAQVMAAVRERLPDLPVPPALDAAPARFRFFDSMTAFLKNAAHKRPLVLIFDDLHGADKPSLLLLQFLARELSNVPLLVIGTYRDSALHRQHPLTYTLVFPSTATMCLRVMSRPFTSPMAIPKIIGQT